MLSDATSVLDRYAGHDDEVINRLKHLLSRAREIRSLIQKVGSAIAPEGRGDGERPVPKLANARLLVADAEESVRKAAHNPSSGGRAATVETARDGHEAIAARPASPSYSAAMVDIRLPDLDGYEVFRRLRAVQPGLPIILMTGFGYDPTHSIVKSRPRRAPRRSCTSRSARSDRLMEAVEQALRPKNPPGDTAE